MDNFSALLGKKLAGSGGGSGTSNYNELENKPQINGNTLSGNKTAANLGLQSAINQNNKLDADLLDDSESEKKLVSENDISNWNGKFDSDDAYTKTQTDEAIENAISALYVTETGGSGKYISAISETDGKIAATPTTFDTALSSSSTNNNAPTSKTVFDDQQRQEVEIGAVANAGAKNDFDIENLIKSAISENVTYSLSGYSLTASSNGRYARVSIPYKFKAGTTVFSAIVSEYSISGGTMYIRFSTESSSAGQIASEIEITNNGQYRREITVNADTDGFVVYYINGSTNAYVNSAVFTNNMIRPASITDNTFVPYAKTNRELTVENASQQSEINYAVNTGAKNFCPKETETSTGSGFTSDVPVNIQAGTYILSFTGTLAYTASLSLYRALPHSGNNIANINLSATTGTQSIEFTISESAKYIAFYHNGSGNSLTNIMIRPASITDATFQPYALPNPTLTPAAIKAVDEGAKNVAQTNDFTKTGDGFVNTDLISGDLFVSAATVSTTASSSTFAVIFYYTNGTVSPTQQLPVTNSVVHEFDTGEKVVSRVRIFAGDTAEASSGKTITLTNFMICTAADWAVSQKFVPYCPTLYELYQMILALQSGGASTQSVQPTLMSAAKPMISTEETLEKEAEPDEVPEIEGKKGAEER